MARAAPAMTIDIPGLDSHRPYLLKYATLQVRQKEVAEDLVQEVFLAAVKGAHSFSGRSSVRTWLTSILRNKIADHFRNRGREVSIDAQEEAHGADSVEALFQSNGDWVHLPQEWRDPEASLADRRFFEALEGCLARLSETAGQAFLLRELMGLTTEEICEQLGVSTSNCSVLLHRARLRLRACLELEWFADDRKR